MTRATAFINIERARALEEMRRALDTTERRIRRISASPQSDNDDKCAAAEALALFERLREMR